MLACYKKKRKKKKERRGNKKGALGENSQKYWAYPFHPFGLPATPTGGMAREASVFYKGLASLHVNNGFREVCQIMKWPYPIADTSTSVPGWLALLSPS